MGHLVRVLSNMTQRELVREAVFTIVYAFPCISLVHKVLH